MLNRMLAKIVKFFTNNFKRRRARATKEMFIELELKAMREGYAEIKA